MITKLNALNAQLDALDDWLDEQMTLIDRELWEGRMTQDEHRRQAQALDKAYREDYNDIFGD